MKSLKPLKERLERLSAAEMQEIGVFLARARLNMVESEFVGTREASELSGVPLLTLQTWVKTGSGKLLPSKTDPTGHKLYRVADIRRLVGQL